MSITVAPDDVRGALDDDDTEYTDEELSFEIRQAEALVNDELVPHSDKTNRLELVGALLAAAFALDEEGVQQIQQGSRQISFYTDDAMDLFEQAKMMDPTGKLENLSKPTSYLGVPDVKGLE